MYIVLMDYNADGSYSYNEYASYSELEEFVAKQYSFGEIERIFEVTEELNPKTIANGYDSRKEAARQIALSKLTEEDKKVLGLQ